MIFITIVTMFYCGKVPIKFTREVKYLYIILAWIIFSLMASKLIESKAIIDEAYNYEWATGINNPTWRGIAFTIRFFFSIYAIQYIISNINDSEKYSLVMKYFIYSFSIFTIFPILQTLILYFFNIELGNIYYEQPDNRLRIGSYVGEPSVLAGMLCGGIFPILSAIIIKNNIVNINKYFLRIVLVSAMISLFLTSSASVIAAMIISLIFFSRKFIGKKVRLLFLIVIFTIALTSINFQKAILFKITTELSTINIRSLSWIVGFNSILDNPFTGTGIGQSPFFVSRYLLLLSDIPFDTNVHFDYTILRHPPMNTYLEFATETGIIGLMLLLVFFKKIYDYQKNRTKTVNQRYIHFAFGAGLFTIALAMNSFPGGFYLGYFNFMIGMYITGLKIYSNPSEERLLS
ncbi:MAG: O-antigen ligase family protein [Deltaproteobacteria bacterium]|nr:O-antigen ligase family protein [Deltaproteobacteria bacterium]